MADYYYGSIQIGGSISSAILPAFVSVLVDAGFEDIEGYDYDNPQQPQRLIEALIEQCKEKPFTLDFSSCEARYGHFEGVEDFCRKNGLTFKASTNSYCEYPAGVTYYDPNLNGGKDQGVDTDDKGSTILPRSTLDRYLETIKELTEDMSRIPLTMDAGDSYYNTVGRIILDIGTNPLEVLTKILEKRFPDLGGKEVPALTILE